MSDKCLACDWDFNAHAGDRAKDSTGEFFCKWCTEAPKEEMIQKLSDQISVQNNISKESAIIEATQKLDSLNYKWK
ncbi:MAG: hypothetical protein N3I35_10320 [Clostridia bacterium]|nr:hypothetical protein [Clostridia bacterium]